MKNKKIFIPLLLILLAVIIVGIIIYPTKKEPEVIKIGAILPLTGELSMFGGWLKEGIDYAIKEQNVKNIEIIYEDNQGQISKAVSAFHKLSTIDKVRAIITAQTPIANALLPLANSNKTFTIFTFADLPKGNKEYVLNYHFPVYDEVKTLAKFAYEKLGRKGAILVVNDEFGRISSDFFEKEFNGEIIYKETFPNFQKDFRSLVSLVENKNPDFIFLIAYTQQLVELTKAIKEANVKFPIIGPNVLTVYLPLIKEYLEQAYFTMSLYDAGKSPGGLYENFITTYKREVGKDPNMVIAEAYEATKILLKALSYSESNLSKFFDDLKTVESVFGKLVIDEERQAHFPLAVMEIKNGEKTKIVWEFNP